MFISKVLKAIFVLTKAIFSLLIFVILGMLFRKQGGRNIKTMRYEEERILRIRKRNLPFETLGTHR